jgi:multidrug efflux system outer membrane protein
VTHRPTFRATTSRVPFTHAALLSAASGLALTLAGCAVGPDYTTKPAKTSESFAAASEAQKPEAQAVESKPVAEAIAPGELARWWGAFGDPLLDSLIERAVVNNHDLRAAAARVREARALRGEQRSRYFPEVVAGGSATRNRISENTEGGQFGPGGEEYSLYEVGLDASWEIDVFGGVRRGNEAADAELSAAVEDRRDVLVTLLAEVARNYTELRGFQQRIALSERTIQAQQETVALTQSRFDAGIASELEVAQAKTQLAARQAQLPPLRSGLMAATHRLGVLLGQEPTALLAELTPLSAIPTPPDRIPVGLPSDLLRRRPDIRRAERQLAAATARIGVETSELFPKFAINGGIAYESAQIGDLFKGGSEAWSFGPSFRWNIFNAGRVRSRIEAANAQEEQAIIYYERTVLTSLEETENALTDLVQEQYRRQALREATEASRRSVSLAEFRYTSGIGDFLNVLESQRALYLAEDELVASEASVTRSLIALYKALGGGWDDRENAKADYRAETPAPEPTPPQG